MLPGRLGLRFALEALFLVLLAVGAGLADLRPLFIVLVMAGAWLLVALVELTAERIARSPVSYLLPAPAPAEDVEPERVFGPRPEERTIVAPPQPVEETEEPVAEAEPEPPAEAEPAPEPQAEPEPEAAREAEPEPAEVDQSEADSIELPPRRFGWLSRRREPELEAEPEPEPEVAAEPEPAEPDEPGAESLEPPSPGRMRSLFRRREREIEPAPQPPPRHVKLLPRRSAPDPSRAEQDVAELFDSGENDEKREETGR